MAILLSQIRWPSNVRIVTDAVLWLLVLAPTLIHLLLGSTCSHVGPAVEGCFLGALGNFFEGLVFGYIVFLGFGASALLFPFIVSAVIVSLLINIHEYRLGRRGLRAILLSPSVFSIGLLAIPVLADEIARQLVLVIALLISGPWAAIEWLRYSRSNVLPAHAVAVWSATALALLVQSVLLV